MITLITLSGHIFLNFLQGWAISRLVSSRRGKVETLCSSLLTGIYLETLFTFVFLFFGLPVRLSLPAIMLFTLALVIFSAQKRRVSFFSDGIFFFKPRWFETFVTIVIVEKIIFSLWALRSTPVYFDDALTHWSIRGRAIFGEVNWSFDPESSVFMGFTGHRHYPLMTPLWRSVTAAFSGEWNDVFARADGLLFFVLALLTVWGSVIRFSGSRWLGAVSVFLLSSLPFHVWHTFSGFSDIAVEAFCVGSMAALLRREWFLAGLLAAGTAWAKNDGIVLFIPSLFLAAIVFQKSMRDVVINGGWFVAGVSTLFPWLIFKALFLPSISPGGEGLAWHSDLLNQFLRTVVNGPTHAAFWIFVMLIILTTLPAMCRDLFGRGLLLFFLTSLSGVLFVFGMTDAYRFLENEMTIHRTMLQFYGVFVLGSVYGVFLSTEKKDDLFREKR